MPGRLAWDSASDAGGESRSGSLVIRNEFAVHSGWQQCATTRNLNGAVDTSRYATFSVDVRALGSTVPTHWRYHCDLRLAVEDGQGNSIELGEVQVIGTNWSRIEMPLNLPPAEKLIRAVTVIAAGSGLAGPVDLWIDNVALRAPPQPPPPLAIRPAGSGVEFFASAPAHTNRGVWQRQEIRTVGGAYSWVGRSQPVSYSMTVVDYPNTSHELFDLHMYLVGNSADPRANADWDEPNVIYLQVACVASGYYMQVVSKVNAPNSSVWNSPLRVGHADSNRPLGSFRLMLQDTFQGTFVAIAWPGGESALSQLPNETSAYFSRTVHLFLGIMPGKVDNIGQSATIERVQVSGAAASLDDSFRNLNGWQNLAQDPAGIVVHPSATIAKVGWLPPPGVWRLTQSPDLTPGSWVESPLAVLTVGTRKLAFVSAMPEAEGQFYRLQHP
ncbi:MAG: hypothetical protein HS113_05180 [Verrucomicrobiales bacterium]|nr:hypothetical protein [Verrucomicrobiales bacterium]